MTKSNSATNEKNQSIWVAGINNIVTANLMKFKKMFKKTEYGEEFPISACNLLHPLNPGGKKCKEKVILYFKLRNLQTLTSFFFGRNCYLEEFNQVNSLGIAF